MSSGFTLTKQVQPLARDEECAPTDQQIQVVRARPPQQYRHTHDGAGDEVPEDERCCDFDTAAAAGKHQDRRDGEEEALNGNQWDRIPVRPEHHDDDGQDAITAEPLEDRQPHVDDQCPSPVSEHEARDLYRAAGASPELPAQVPNAKISVCHGVGGMFAASGTIIFTNEG